jgi:hypothetical protein
VIPEYLNTPPEAQHAQRKEQKNERKDKRKGNYDHPLAMELNIPKCDQPKAPQNTKKKKLPSSKPRSKNTN